MLKPPDYVAVLFMLMYSASATITPICFVTLANDFNLSLTEGGGIEGVRTFLIFLSLFLSGFAAAKFGKIRSVIIAGLCCATGFAVFAFAQSYVHILCAVLVIGFGSGIIEGLVNPIVQAAHPTDSGKYLNITNAFWSVGVLSTTLLCGELLTIGVSWRYFMAFLAVFSLICSLVGLSVQKHISQVKINSSKDIVNQYVQCFTAKHFWIFFLIMIFAGGVEGAFTFWSASYIQVHFNSAARLAGLGTACFAFGMMLVRILGGLFVKQKYLRRFILSSAVFGLCISFTVPFIQSVESFLVVLFLNGLAIACFWPSIQSYAVDRMPFDSTTVFILLSCAGIPGFGFTSFIMGVIGDTAGFDVSFFVVPAMLVCLCLLILIERKIWKK